MAEAEKAPKESTITLVNRVIKVGQLLAMVAPPTQTNDEVKKHAKSTATQVTADVNSRVAETANGRRSA